MLAIESQIQCEHQLVINKNRGLGEIKGQSPYNIDIIMQKMYAKPIKLTKR